MVLAFVQSVLAGWRRPTLATGGIGEWDAGVAPSRSCDAMALGGQSTPPEEMYDIFGLEFGPKESFNVVLGRTYPVRSDTWLSLRTVTNEKKINELTVNKLISLIDFELSGSEFEIFC